MGGRPGERGRKGGREAADMDTTADVDTMRAPTGLNLSLGYMGILTPIF